jgi:hypothetical protein
MDAYTEGSLCLAQSQTQPKLGFDVDFNFYERFGIFSRENEGNVFPLQVENTPESLLLLPVL